MKDAGLSGDLRAGWPISELTTVRADKVHVLPEGVDLHTGALVEPMATSRHAVELHRRRGAGWVVSHFRASGSMHDEGGPGPA